MRRCHSDGLFSLPLYRFVKHKWAQCFFTTGQLRLGTIYDYAKNEQYGSAIHDRKEGFYNWIVPREKWSHGIPEVRSIAARNNLVLCLTTDYDEKMYDEFDANCCIRINSMAFFYEIDKILKDKFTELVIGKVKYYDKESWAETPNYLDFAGFMKDSRYSNQREVRALWEPNTPTPMEGGWELQEGDVSSQEDNILTAAVNSDYHRKYVKKQSKWLKPLTIFVPQAIQHCSLIKKPRTK